MTSKSRFNKQARSISLPSRDCMSGSWRGCFGLSLPFFGCRESQGQRSLLCAYSFYAAVTGLHTASVRAAVMSTLLMAGIFFDRKVLALNSLAAAGFLILLWDSNQLFTSGFQLSFCVVAAIILLANPLYRTLRRVGQPRSVLATCAFQSAQEILDQSLRCIYPRSVSVDRCIDRFASVRLLVLSSRHTDFTLRESRGHSRRLLCSRIVIVVADHLAVLVCALDRFQQRQLADVANGARAGASFCGNSRRSFLSGRSFVAARAGGHHCS